MVQLQQCCALGALSLPPGAFGSQNTAFQFAGEWNREMWAEGDVLYVDDEPFAEWKLIWNDFSFGTAGNDHQSCGPERRGHMISFWT